MDKSDAAREADQERDREPSDVRRGRRLLGRRLPGLRREGNPVGPESLCGPVPDRRRRFAAAKKYTIGPYGRVTFHQARVSAQKVFAARLEGRDLAAEKRDARKRMVADRVEELLEAFITQHVSQNRSARATSQMLRRELSSWSGRSIHEISKRDVIEVISTVEQRGAPVAANKTLKAIKTFLRWCVGRAVLDHSPAEGIPLPTKEVPRDRVLTDDELARVILAARKIGGPYGGIVELLALTGQRREEAARCVWDEIDLDNRLWTLPNLRTKNA